MPSLGLTIMLLLLLVGNLFGLLTLQLKKEKVQAKNLLLTSSIINFLKGIQLLNIIAIAGVWFFHSWAVWLGLFLTILIVAVDIRLKIWYHVGLAILSSSITGYFIWMDWHLFR